MSPGLFLRAGTVPPLRNSEGRPPDCPRARKKPFPCGDPSRMLGKLRTALRITHYEAAVTRLPFCLRAVSFALFALLAVAAPAPAQITWNFTFQDDLANGGAGNGIGFN